MHLPEVRVATLFPKNRSKILMNTVRQHLAILFILVTFVATAGLYSVINPLFEAPDEDLAL